MKSLSRIALLGFLSATLLTGCLPEEEQAGSAAGRSATLSWEPPAENADGSPLTPLAGYKIYYGTTPGQYSESIAVPDPAVTSYTVDGLAPGTYYFAITAVDTNAQESGYGDEVSKRVR